MSEKYLVVGDPHVTVANLDSAQRLLGKAFVLAQEHKAKLLILGDLHHNHAVINLKVLAFWDRFFKKCECYRQKTVVLVGNHDRAGDGNRLEESSMMPYDSFDVEEGCLGDYAPLRGYSSITIVSDTFVDIEQKILFLAYHSNHQEFLEKCQAWSKVTDLLIAHQTFDGTQYENGFFALDGIDANLVPQQTIISGHIHKSSRFGKVWYPGSPRWLTLNDANQEKNIYLLEIEEGKVIQTTKFPTSDVCTKIVHLEDKEQNQSQPFKVNPLEDARIDIYGSQSYIDSRVAHYQALGVKCRTFKDKIKKDKVKESDGIKTSFQKWVQNYQANNGSKLSDLNNLIKERLRDQV